MKCFHLDGSNASIASSLTQINCFISCCLICLCAVVLVQKTGLREYGDWAQEHREVRMGGGHAAGRSDQQGDPQSTQSSLLVFESS